MDNAESSVRRSSAIAKLLHVANLNISIDDPH